jgi:SHS2 domain-containing protein
MKKYQYIDHTADTGLKVFGTTLAGLFENAAEGMFDIISDPGTIDTILEKQLKVTAADREALLLEWLSELNYLFQTEDILFRRFRIEQLSDNSLTGRAYGEKFDPQKHRIHTEIKAVTFHQLYVRQSSDGWQAQVIFDL